MTEADDVKPKTTRRNPDETTAVALAIIDAADAERNRKTARLRALRLEQQQAEVKKTKKAPVKSRKPAAVRAAG